MRRDIDEALEIFRELGDERGIGRCEWAHVEHPVRRSEHPRGPMQHALHALELFEADRRPTS